MRRMSAADLAHRVGVSRQTIYAIEDGRFIPNTTVSLQLARALNVSVEEIFCIADEQADKPITADLLSTDRMPNEGQLARLCRVNKRLIAVPTSLFPAYLPPADGIIESKKKLTVSIKSPGGLLESDKQLLLAGCDPALSLVHELLSPAGIDIVCVSCSSRWALRWLKQGKIHAAGSHLFDRATGDYNVPIIRRLLPNISLRVVTFAVWEQGLVLRHGNPKGIRSIADLARKDVVLMNREKGSGSRDLLDTGLHQLGIKPARVRGYNSIAQGHLAAAYAVAAGTADCCIAPRSASRCFGLDFIPLAVERFDVSFTRASLELPATKALLDLLNRSSLRKKLQCIAGYDTAHTGEVLV
jgi:putative molybdopterin biosynthesis protein